MSWLDKLRHWLRPKPQPPIQPPMARLSIWATDAATGQPVANAAVDLYEPDFPAPEDGRTNADGYFGLQVKLGTHLVEVHADGYGSEMKSVPVTGDHDEQFPLTATVPPPSPVLKAGQAGKLEAAANRPVFTVVGQAWRWLACDGFALPLLIAAGEDVGPFLDWAIATGFVQLRCFFGLHYIAQQMGRRPFLATPDQTRRVMETLAARELRCEWTVGDMQMLMPEPSDQRRWYDAQIQVLKDFPLVAAETVNEGFKNGVNASFIGRFGYGIVQTSGNYAPPCEPRLDYGVTHTPRDEEWPRKGKELYDLYNGFDPDLPGGVRAPWVSDEPMGADEQNKPGSRSNVPNDFYDDAAVCALMGAGGTFHFTDGIFGRLPGPVQQQCAEAYVAGSRAIRLDAADGSYTRGGLGDSPLEHDDAKALRTFGRIQGNKATCVAVRPQAGWQAVARNGWHIVAASGPDGRVVRLER